MAKLFYVMGASGVGKDSLLNYAREHVPDGALLVFAHRYITRPADAGGENHIELSAREFAELALRDCFAMHWRSHGNAYGIGSEINRWLEQGFDVVVNGSRAYFPEALERYSNLVPVLIEADKDQIEARLLQRGRETDQQLESRLEAANSMVHQLDHPALIRIENNQELAIGGQAFIDVLVNELRIIEGQIGTASSKAKGAKCV